MSKKRKGLLAVVIVTLLLTGICWSAIGCSSQENQPQIPAQTSGDAQPPEGMAPPEGGTPPEGIPPVGGFNISDEELE